MSGEVWVSPCGRMELRCGRWQDVLRDVECDAVITDPPYGERTHNGQRHGRHRSQDGKAVISARGLGYSAWTGDDIAEIVSKWPEPPWFCALTSDDLAPVWRREFELIGRTAFAPLACVQRGMNVRLAGDGPSNWTTWLMVARTKSAHKWGTLPGAYTGSPCDPGRATQNRGERPVAGGKPVWLMRSIVSDYSRPGDLICDPCAGGGTTLLAAAIEGRRAIGAEVDLETYAKAVKRLSAGYTPALQIERKPAPVQGGLL